MIETAILIFSRSARQESRYKKLHPDNKINERVHKALQNKTIKIVEETGLPYFLIDENNQVGNSFGERIANAVEYVFKKKYRNVIAIGNDCPQLSSKVLLDAAEKINETKLVVGPDNNGGMYLFGISEIVFDTKAFSEIPWQSKEACNALLQYQDLVYHEICLLEKLRDFNKPNDFYFLKKASRLASRFIILLDSIITGNKKIGYSILASIYRFRFLNIKQFRAPPVSC